MRLLILVAAVTFHIRANIHAQISDEQALAITSEWKATADASSKGNINPQDLTQVGARYKEFLATKPSTALQIQLQEKGAETMIDFLIAEEWQRAGNYDKALEYLINEVEHQTLQGGSFLENAPSRNPDLLKNDVFELHSEIMAHIGKVNQIKNSGYEVLAMSAQNGKTQFAFVAVAPGAEEGNFAIHGLAEDDERRAVYLSTADESSHYRVSDHAQVVAKRGSFAVMTKPIPEGLALAFDGITKVVEYKGEFGALLLHASPQSHIELRVYPGRIEQPIQAIKASHFHAPAVETSKTSLPSQTEIPPLSPYSKPAINPQTATPDAAHEPTSQGWFVWLFVVIAATGSAVWVFSRKSK